MLEANRRAAPGARLGRSTVTGGTLSNQAAIPLMVAALGLMALGGCDHPNPQMPAEPIGEFPEWGQNFAEEESQPAGSDSLLAGSGPAPSDAPNNAELSGGGGSATPNMKSPFGNDDWSDGDPEFGKQVYLAHCARCHGPDGKGGNMPGVGAVPTLADPEWHARTTNKQIASTIAHGKGAMPSFMQTFDRRQLTGVIAYLRTLSER